MDLAWILAVSIALGADAFSLSLAIGLAGIRKRMVVHLSVVVAAFHVVMPLCGIVLGQALGSVLGRFANALGAIVLIALGGRMLYHVYRPSTERYSFAEAREAFFRRRMPGGVSLNGVGVYALAISVSLDALSVGFSLGTLKTEIGMTVITMGMVAGLMTGAGLILGRLMGTWLGDRAEMLGGFVLLLIGIKLFF